MNSTPLSLLERLQQAADPAAWVRFVDFYSPLLYRWAQQLGLQPSDAADLVQDVFEILVRKLATFEYQRDKSFRKWLRTVLRNKWRDRQRKLATAPATQGGGDPNLLLEPDNQDDVEEAEYRRYLVAKALRVLRPDFEPITWQAFEQHVFLSRSATEVAAELGISVNAVYLAKSRVVRRLREELTGLLE